MISCIWSREQWGEEIEWSKEGMAKVRWTPELREEDREETRSRKEVRKRFESLQDISMTNKIVTNLYASAS